MRISFQVILSKLDVDVAAGSSLQFSNLLKHNPSYDLVIYELMGDSLQNLAQIEQTLVDDGGSSMLLIVEQEALYWPSFANSSS